MNFGQTVAPFFRRMIIVVFGGKFGSVSGMVEDSSALLTTLKNMVMRLFTIESG